MVDSIGILGEATLFSTLNASSGYWQAKTDKRDVDKTAPVTHNGLYGYTRMIFGLENAVETLQNAMDVILATIKRQYALIHIEVIIVFMKTPKGHLQHIGEVLKLQSIDGMTISLKKCSFCSETIDYLGHVIAPGKLHVAIRNTEAIRAPQYTTTASPIDVSATSKSDYQGFVQQQNKRCPWMGRLY